MTRIARTASVGLMILLLILAACSSTPRVVETGQAPEPIPAAYRALIEAHPDFQMVATLAAKEGKRVDWSKATQSTDPSGRWVVQIPLWWDSNGFELITVGIDRGQVTSVLLSRVEVSGEVQALEVAFTDLSTQLAVVGLVGLNQDKPVFEMSSWGRSKNTLSLQGLLTVESNGNSGLTKQQASCAEVIAQLTLAIAGLAAATYGLYAACNPFTWWTPACLAALVGYALAYSNYNYWVNQANRYGCIY